MRTFGLAEANALLPKVSSLMGELLQVRRETAVAHLELEALQRKPSTSGRLQTTLAQNAGVLQERVIALIEKLHALGCVVKDVDLGLVDFPSIANGALINLCWKFGEPSIEYWHRMDEGFAWRKPIDELTHPGA